MFLRCEFHSSELGMATQANIIIPQRMSNAIGINGAAGKVRDIPVLYLLHGYSDDHSIWCRRTSIERYAADYNLAIVMPDAAHSFYTDMAHGQKWGSYISRELPQLVEDYLPVSSKREDRFIAGLSMGGYGAFKIALNNPDRYAAAASLSGCLDIANRADNIHSNDSIVRSMTNIFGNINEIAGSNHDLFAVAERLVEGNEPKPALYQICGTEDFLYDANVKFKAHLEKIGYEFKYFEEPGTHNWGFWDSNIQKVLKWLPLAENM